MKTNETVDILIVGAGPAGLAAAIGFADRGFSVAVADTSPDASASAASGRSAALLSQTVAFLKTLGVWDACEAVSAPLKVLQFIDDTGRTFRAPDTAFAAGEIGEPAFGYNIANADLVGALRDKLTSLGIAVMTPGEVQACVNDGHRLHVTFASGAGVTAQLGVAADGRLSAMRGHAGIRTLSWAYDQVAIATSFTHERPHNGICIELHRAAGPFTMVPLPDNRSSLVWVERRAEAERIAALDDADFAQEVERVSRFAFGRVSDVRPRARFPLSSLMARDYGWGRIALVGEAAHVTPPIGAQGLNLGFRDVDRLLVLATKARTQRSDIGGDELLRAYSSVRRADIVTRTVGVDVLNRSLLSGFLPFTAGRGLGLYALGTIGPLRRAFMRQGIAPTV